MPDSPAITTQRIPPLRTASQSTSMRASSSWRPTNGSVSDRVGSRVEVEARMPTSRRAAQEREIRGFGLLRRAHSQLLVEPAPALLVDSERLAAAAERVVRGHQRSGRDLVERIDARAPPRPGSPLERARPAPSAASVAMCRARSRCPRTRSCQRRVHVASDVGKNVRPRRSSARLVRLVGLVPRARGDAPLGVGDRAKRVFDVDFGVVVEIEPDEPAA